jgi:hypothetical protein
MGLRGCYGRVVFFDTTVGARLTASRAQPVIVLKPVDKG